MLFLLDSPQTDFMQEFLLWYPSIGFFKTRFRQQKSNGSWILFWSDHGYNSLKLSSIWQCHAATPKTDQRAAEAHSFLCSCSLGLTDQTFCFCSAFWGCSVLYTCILPQSRTSWWVSIRVYVFSLGFEMDLIWALAKEGRRGSVVRPLAGKGKQRENCSARKWKGSIFPVNWNVKQREEKKREWEEKRANSLGFVAFPTRGRKRERKKIAVVDWAGGHFIHRWTVIEGHFYNILTWSLYPLVPQLHENQFWIFVPLPNILLCGRVRKQPAQAISASHRKAHPTRCVYKVVHYNGPLERERERERNS